MIYSLWLLSKKIAYYHNISLLNKSNKELVKVVDNNDLCPKISVILSVYNSSAFLGRCLDSIISQSFKDIEIICVDDESTDDSLDILKEYEKKDSRIKVFTQSHGGAGKARNTGIDYAKGEYLSILDSDDFFDFCMLEKAYISAKENDADIVIYGTDFFDDKKRIFIPCDYSFRKDLVNGQFILSANSIPDKIFNICCGWAWDKLFKTGFVKKCGVRFQEIRTTNDMFFVFCLLSKAERICYFDKVMVHRRINVNNSLSVTRERSWEDFYSALYALKERLIYDGTYEKFKRSFVNWALNFSLWQIDTIDNDARRKITAKCRNHFLMLMISSSLICLKRHIVLP